MEVAKGNEAVQMVHFYRLEGDVRVKHSGEFSWKQSADAMQVVLESVHAGRRASGVI